MTKSPKISVIVPCFNHGEFLPEAVASVTSMNRDDVELIVVDDGSTDERTRKEMDVLEATGIFVIRQEHKGLAAARNAGISASRGEYILPLDADNRIRPAYIEHGIRVLDANPKVGVVYGDQYRIPHNGANDPRRPLGRASPGPLLPSRLMACNYIDACAVYRRVIWEQNGGYDATMPFQGLEDWDFWLGALEHGWEFHYVPQILFDYRVSGDSMITRTYDRDAEIHAFLGNKHGRLYRDAWAELAVEHESGKATFRNLRRLIKLRIAQKLARNGHR